MLTDTPNISRRSFIIGTAAVGSGLALGLNVPFGPAVVRAADGSPEVNVGLSSAPTIPSSSALRAPRWARAP